MASPPYRYALTLTSQFYFCSLPLRLDTYSKCGFKCAYCFAHARGGNRADGVTRRADPFALSRQFERVERHPKSVVDQLLARRQPLHLGGMSDPFPPVERHARTTLEVLRVLAERRYPTIISTKSNLFAEDEYLEVLQRGVFLVQVSVSSLDDSLLGKIDVGTPGPTALFVAIARARSAGIPVSLRIQPLLPGREDDAIGVIAAAGEVGVHHVAAEHLKLPLELSWDGTSRLVNHLGRPQIDAFEQHGIRVGREWILPVDDRIETILKLRDAAHEKGLTFGAADNDLLTLSDGNCCCSGADLLPGFERHLRCNYTNAVRKGMETGLVNFGSIDQEWLPQGSIAMYVNSRSRLPAKDGQGAGVLEYLRRNWNGSPNGSSPGSFYGVLPTDEALDGLRIYEINPTLMNWMRVAQLP